MSTSSFRNYTELTFGMPIKNGQMIKRWKPRQPSRAVNLKMLLRTSYIFAQPFLTDSAQLTQTKAQWQEDEARTLEGILQKLLNRPPPPPLHNDDLVTSAVEADSMINIDPPTEHEIAAAIWRFKTRKAPGVCSISADILKAGGTAFVTWLSHIFCKVWDNGEAPDDWKKSIIVPFYKGKGSRRECKNYRGITLLSFSGKIFASILSGVKNHLLSHRRTEQLNRVPHSRLFYSWPYSDVKSVDSDKEGVTSASVDCLRGS